MTSKGYALARAALIKTLTAYSGITTEDGDFDGTATLVDSNLKGRNDFITGKTILIMSGDAKDEDKGATAFDNSDGKITLQGTGFSAQIKVGTIFKVLNISSIEIDVANIDTKIGASTDPAGTTTLFAWMAKIFASGDDIEGKLDSPAHGLAAIINTISAVLAKLIAVQGGTETLESLDDELDAILDLAGGNSETLAMTGAEQELYKEEAGTTIRLFSGLYIDWTGLSAGAGEDTTIKAYRKYGANWRKFYEESFLAVAVPDPPVTPVPRDINTQCVPTPIYYKQGIKITAQQAAEGGGWNTLTFDKVTGAPGA